MVQNLAKITFKQIDNSIAEAAFLFVSEVFVTRSTLHRAINIKIDLYRVYLKASYQQAIDQGLSIVAVDESEQEICGVLIATDIVVSDTMTEVFRPKNFYRSQNYPKNWTKSILRRGR